jgi:radical SAM superfamily enzyme YgiQ (UPF0313 family)
MIAYLDPLYRPPAEASSVILQVTYGCSYNECTFCSMYRTKGFHTRSLDELKKEIDILSKDTPSATKVFLADGDALVLETNILLELLKYLQKSFKSLRRVSLYATVQNIQNKTFEQLEQLRANKLSLIYIGIESGNDTILSKINKGINSVQIIDALNKISDANIKISATVILGIAGVVYSSLHAKASANIVNKTTINYLSTLQLGLDDIIKEQFYKNFPEYIALNDYDILQEQRIFIENIEPSNKVIFRSNHASNALHLKGTLPKDKNRLINELDIANILKDEVIIPMKYRGF